MATDVKRCIQCRFSAWPKNENGYCEHAQARRHDGAGQYSTGHMRLPGSPCGLDGLLWESKNVDAATTAAVK